MAHTAIAPQVSGPDSTPATFVNAQSKGGVVRSSIGVIAAADFVAGTVGQTYAFCRVPARARLMSVKAYGGAATSGSVKVGLFRPNNGIAIDDDVITTALDLAADKHGTDIMNVVPTVDPSSDLATRYATAVGTAGATSDVEYDIVATVVTVANAGTLYALEATYVLPE